MASAGGGLEGDARTIEVGGDDRAAGGLAGGVIPCTRPARASCGPGGVVPGTPVTGTYSPDHFGLLGSGSVDFTTAGSPVPQLIVSAIAGTGSMPMGCRREAVPGIDERDWRNPPAQGRAFLL